MSIESRTSFSPERAADVGMGLGELLASGCAAWACSASVRFLGDRTESLARGILSTPFNIPSATPGVTMVITPACFIPEKPVYMAINACTNSGSTAAVTVGFFETLIQLLRYSNSDHTQSWGTDMIEGGYRGAAIGTITGFVTGGDQIGQKIAAALVGGFVGCIAGNGIAGISHGIRNIHLPVQNKIINDD
ncbi:MAG TPA: hypothetical protein VLE96_02970 [Chlamydiales bacterium]|nr:hypothetical protein [Chlamydiales bacterium]